MKKRILWIVLALAILLPAAASAATQLNGLLGEITGVEYVNGQYRALIGNKIEFDEDDLCGSNDSLMEMYLEDDDAFLYRIHAAGTDEMVTMTEDANGHCSCIVPGRFENQSCQLRIYNANGATLLFYSENFTVCYGEVTLQPASGRTDVDKTYTVTYETNFDYVKARLYDYNTDQFRGMMGIGSGTIMAQENEKTITYYIKFEINDGYSSYYVTSAPFTVTWDYTNFLITIPTGGRTDVGQTFPITYSANFEFTDIRLYGKYGYTQTLEADGSDEIRASAYADTDTFTIQYTYTNGHYIISDPFTVTWDYASYHVTGQPVGGTTVVGNKFPISFQTNFGHGNPDLYEGVPDGEHTLVETMSEPYAVPAQNSETTKTYYVDFYFSDSKGTYHFYSDPFTVTWGHDLFAVTTQPADGMIGVGNSYSFSYATNYDFSVASLYQGTPGGEHTLVKIIKSYNTNSPYVPAEETAKELTFYIEFKLADGYTVNSNTFDVTWNEYAAIDFDANGGTGSIGREYIVKGLKFTLPVCGFTAPENKEFDTWDKGAPGDEITVNEDIVVKALWKDLLWNITFDANGGSGSMPAETVARGQKYTLPSCTLSAPANKEFDRWDKGAPGDQISITADTVIKALWKDLTWTITFDAGEGSGSMAPATVVRGQQYMLPNCSFTAPADRAFDRWDKGNPGEKIDVTGDTVVTALWKDRPLVPETWTITFEAGEGSGIMAAAVVNRGEKYTLPACSFTAPANKVFDQWDKGAPGTQIDIYADTVVTAMWKDKPAAPASSGPVEKITFSKLKKVKLTALSTKKLKITWKKLSKKDQKKIQKIQIDYSTDKTFKTGVKTRWAKKGKASYTIKGLKKNTKYWVRIRAWKKDGNIIYVSKWVTKNKKTKKK